MQTKQTLAEIKANGYRIDFGTVFNNAFENYKKIALNAGLAMLLITILAMIIFGILAVGIVGIALSVDSLAQFKVENMTPLWLASYMFFLIIFTALASPINAGFIKMAQSAAKGENVSVGAVFEYYRGGYFKEIVMATLIIALFSTIFSIGLQWVGFPILGMLLNFLISTLTFLTIPLIIFGNLKAMEAIEGSILVVSKQFFILLALLIVATIFMMMGLFGFCIGIFFTLPFMYSMYYCIYTEIMGDDTHEIPVETLADESAME
jgi:hypothetical protein